MKNIMLLFLSDLHLDRNLKLIPTKYLLQDGTALDCVQTNESAVRYMNHILSRDGNQINEIYLFSTNRVKEEITYINDMDVRIKTTHQDFFMDRLVEKIGYDRTHIHVVDYDDGTLGTSGISDDAEESIRQVASMVEQIKTYINIYGDEEIWLHADMTGGFRHASMMMLSVIQLLGFCGIRIGQVVYSDFNQKRIIDVTEVQHMFTLISGAEEFVSYGSVSSIENYFAGIAREQSKECRELLSEMKSFSDAIKICQISTIESVLQTLDTKIIAFQQHNPKSLHEEMFSKILDTIRQGYDSLISSSPSRLDIIEWCAHKGFLQQAMTMCTEWIPTMIVDGKICYPTDPETVMKSKNDKLHHSWQQTFIATYNKSQYAVEQKDTLRNNIVSLFKKIQMGQVVESQDIASLGINTGKLSDFIVMLQHLDEILADTRKELQSVSKITAESFMKTKRKKLSVFFQQNPNVAKVLRYSYYKMGLNYVQDFLSFFSWKVSQELVLSHLQGMSLYEMEKMFKIPAHQTDSSARLQIKTASVIDNKWGVKCLQYKEMFDEKIIGTEYNGEFAMDILKRYFYLREQRNSINHVNDQNIEASEQIKKDIEDYIRLLKCKDKYKIN